MGLGNILNDIRGLCQGARERSGKLLAWSARQTSLDHPQVSAEE